MRTAIVALAGVSALGLAATTASAKSNIEFTAGPRTAHVGGMIHLKVDGGDDDASVWERLCIQERTGHEAWHNLKCAKGDYGYATGLDIRIKASHKGSYQFRGALIESKSPKDKHYQYGPTSRAYTVTVR
ncbi:hypothetical protein AB0L75_24655 [Streptomyces sp. NPDC052101]|uniref:hypothetical protein n=1 Tax=Streptomyces sp. NPDC052101 TaxID=3155763 RepID=UPI00341AF9BA